jgi:hypothetical protein
VMEAVTEPMSHEEVEAHLAAMLGQHPDEAFNQPGYHHPAGGWGATWQGGQEQGWGGYACVTGYTTTSIQWSHNLPDVGQEI